ncbi:hypothetical protein HK405_003880 [Cladochytrium tenue]|nr:hypothetical protein HK405_003880 [Cladochytrium tenue]
MHGARAAADLLAEILAHHFRRGRMAAVPWVEPLVLELDRLRGLYSMSTLRPVGSGGEGRADGGAGSGAVLMAEAGQRAADELLELAALSVGVGSGERLAAERLGAVGAGGATSAVPHSPPRQHAAAHAQLPPHSTVVAGKEHATPPPWERPVSVHYADLTELLAARPTLADMKAMHFVLARTYHGDDGALWALSLTLQPASEAERRELLYLQPPPPPPPQASLPADGQRRVEEPLVGDDEDDGFGISGDDDGDENDDDDEGMPALTRDLARALLAAGSGGSAPADARFVPSGPALSSRPSTAETSSPSSRSNYSRTPDNASDDESGSSHGDAGETRRLLAELDGLPAARSVGPPAGDVSAAAGGAMPSLPPLSPPSLPHPADPPLPPQLSQAPPEGGGGGGEGSDSGAGVAADGTAAPVQRASAERLESGAGGAGGAGHAEVGEVDELLDMSADDYL